ncbi:40S ribosomal protein S2 [Thelohanellus kitauei]|uniref:Small ribosomal subunit protein uS5 n=1 Tax=Thelohanellus kitauei TaxID=669202 RepID=A0A0C2J081_THEKT|nr:40S ribosomal protein S2 [Thelohanellus kitauei]
MLAQPRGNEMSSAPVAGTTQDVKPDGAGRRVGGGRPMGKGFKRRRPQFAPQEQEWKPITKLGRLVQGGQIKSLEEIFMSSLPIKEPQIVDYFLKDVIKEQTLRIQPVQKQTHAGQRTRFMAIVACGDRNGHVSLGVKVASEVAGAIRGAGIQAKISMIPVKFGYWGNKIGEPHTVPCKVTGKCGSVSVRLIPAPRGAGLVAGPIPKILLELAGVEDCFTSSKGNTSTVCNVARATYLALKKTYEFLTPDQWAAKALPPSPFQQYTDVLSRVEVN